MKNLNSSKFVRRALDLRDRAPAGDPRARRHGDARRRGSGTRTATSTEGMRTKESAHDYRYFPEPDLPPFTADAAFLAAVERSLVELPEARARAPRRRARPVRRAGPADLRGDARSPTTSSARSPSARTRRPRRTWLAADVRKHLNRTGLTLAHVPAHGGALRRAAAPARRAAHPREDRQERARGGVRRGQGPRGDHPREGLGADRRPAALGAVADTASCPARGHRGRHPQGRPPAHRVPRSARSCAQTSGRAEPGLLQQVVKDRLDVSMIQVLSFGGAITARRHRRRRRGRRRRLRDPAACSRSRRACPRKVAFEEVEVARVLSEEITPDGLGAPRGGDRRAPAVRARPRVSSWPTAPTPSPTPRRSSPGSSAARRARGVRRRARAPGKPGQRRHPHAEDRHRDGGLGRSPGSTSPSAAACSRR